MVLQIAFKITTPSETLSANPTSKELMGMSEGRESRHSFLNDSKSSWQACVAVTGWRLRQLEMSSRTWRPRSTITIRQLHDEGCEPWPPNSTSCMSLLPSFLYTPYSQDPLRSFFLFFGLSVCRPIFLSLADSRISRHCNSWGFKRVKKEQGSMGRAWNELLHRASAHKRVMVHILNGLWIGVLNCSTLIEFCWPVFEKKNVWKLAASWSQLLECHEGITRCMVTLKNSLTKLRMEPALWREWRLHFGR